MSSVLTNVQCLKANGASMVTAGLSNVSSTVPFLPWAYDASAAVSSDDGINSPYFQIYNADTMQYESYNTTGTYLTATYNYGGKKSVYAQFQSGNYTSTSANVAYPTVYMYATESTALGSELGSKVANFGTSLSTGSYILRRFVFIPSKGIFYAGIYTINGTSPSILESNSIAWASNLQTAYDELKEAAGGVDLYLYAWQYKIQSSSSIRHKGTSIYLYFSTVEGVTTTNSVVDDDTGETVEPESSGETDVTDDDTTDSDSTDSDTDGDDTTSGSDSTDSDTDGDDTTSGSDSSVVGYDADSDGGYQGYYQSIYDYMAIAHPNTENWTSVHSADSSVGARTVTLTDDNYTEYLETWQVNALPLRCYNLIYKEWFRDENLIDSPAINKDDGVDDGIDYKLLKRAKRHDYFTAALPWTQKGDVVDITSILSATGDAADIGLAITATNASAASASSDTIGAVGFILRSDTYSQAGGMTPSDETYGLNPYATVVDTATTSDGTANFLGVANSVYGTTQLQLTGESIANILAQSVVTSFTINELREAFQIQRLLERDARSGTRYTEILRGHFGVISPDARLQRPEYLGGHTTMLNINSVAQTSSTNETSPQGNLSAYGVMASKHSGFNKSFVEHGYILGLVSIRSDLTYQQGLHKMWTRQTRYDFYWPVLAHLGEQAVYNRELYFQNDTDVDEAVFGYQERWSEYRYFPSQITGLFRSSYKETLDFWHLAQYFEELPKLNQDFIEENVPIERVIAVTSEPHFLLDVWFSMHVTRPMPTYSVPGLIDHF